MNRLETYIREHKSLFDEEPAPGHFERLRERMNRKKRKNIALRWSVSIAASIAVLLTAGILWQNTLKPTNILVCENQSDMKICYIERMLDVAGKIETLTKDFDRFDRQEIMNEVHYIIESVGDFESEIPEELSDDAAKAILSDYYLHHLESLKMIAHSITN
jgi:hypothetical protein